MSRRLALAACLGRPACGDWEYVLWLPQLGWSWVA
jgi:hypothetical protein